ncbi:hypothetical protein H0B56_00045 [Haloechinothrix sp. YIM 98757]|uniref:Glycosyl transferases group 1 n=1 Tax=Haloechinothrix aidingensis TaxID=2752311 RepID=A0A838A335_9PSEU|nr:hypothetical protein [Haloechinothrix aidingensis]MBA0123930.1 hypothetical protein [Haloechinothrix aidingensis]
MARTSAAFDILMVTDCRFPGGNSSSVVEEIHAQHRAGYRTGILHVPSPILRAARPFADKIRDVLDGGLAELVVGVDEVHAKLLLARHPSVFTELPDGLPEVHADEVVLAVNQVPADERGLQPYYDVPHVQHQIERLVGKGATWAPIGPRTRDALAEHRDAVPMLPWDWENVIDVDQWRVPRHGFVSDRPVLGRHSRGHWSKWPEEPAEILAAYPEDPHYDVRILGGVDIPVERVGYLPDNWVDYPFNSMPAHEFLASVDFFVYFHHSGLVEAFGRVVLEALSAGAVAIVPPYLEPLFGDTCLYGSPHDVRGYVDQLYGDWESFAERSRAGVELAQRRFSYDTHVRRVAELIGQPEASRAGQTGEPASPSESATGPATEHAAGPAAGSAAGRPLVVDLTRHGGPEGLLTGVLRAAAGPSGTCVAAVPGARSHDVGQAAVETFPRVLDELDDRERSRYLTARVTGLVHAHRPTSIVLLTDGNLGVRDVLTATGRPNLDAVHVHPGDRDGTPEGELASAIAAGLPGGWVATPPPGRPSGGGSPAPRPVTQRLLDRLPVSWHLHTRARRKMRTLRREHLDRLMDTAEDVGVVLFEAEDAELSLPVPARVTHPVPQRLPVALVVVPGADLDPEPNIRALLARQQITSGFRLALLAPPRWEAEAARHGLAIETLVDERSWTALHGTGWPAYLRQRVHEASLAFQPHTVAFAESPIGGPGGSESVLEVLEAARVRRRMETRQRRPR